MEALASKQRIALEGFLIKNHQSIFTGILLTFSPI